MTCGMIEALLDPEVLHGPSRDAYVAAVLGHDASGKPLTYKILRRGAKQAETFTKARRSKAAAKGTAVARAQILRAAAAPAASAEPDETAVSLAEAQASAELGCTVLQGLLGSVKVSHKESDKLVVIDPSHVEAAAKAGFERVSLAMPDPKAELPREEIRAIQQREEAKVAKRKAAGEQASPVKGITWAKKVRRWEFKVRAERILLVHTHTAFV